MAEARRPETVRQEIAVEREQLAQAVERLRAEMTSVKRQVGSRLKIVAAGLAGAIVLIAGLPRLVRYVVGRLRRD